MSGLQANYRDYHAEGYVREADEARATVPPKPKAPNRIPRPSLRPLIADVRKNPIFWIGVAAFFLPGFVDLAANGWSTDAGSHAPILLGAVLWMIVRALPDFKPRIARPPLILALAACIPPLLLFFASRVTGLFEIKNVALYLAVIAFTYALVGGRAIWALGFPILYGIFLLPLPETVIDIGTQPFKLAISRGVVELLSRFDFPVAQTGVSIMIGPYELLIAAACAGLHSLISLTAIGLVYIYLKNDGRRWHNVALMTLVFPIAVLANFIRVLLLVLLTYYAGDEVAQGMLHETAGMFMFITALGLLMGIDSLMSPNKRKRHANA